MKNKGKASHHFPPSYCDVACGRWGYESRENVTKVLGKDGTKHAGGRGQHTHRRGWSRVQGKTLLPTRTVLSRTGGQPASRTLHAVAQYLWGFISLRLSFFVWKMGAMLVPTTRGAGVRLHAWWEINDIVMHVTCLLQLLSQVTWCDGRQLSFLGKWPRTPGGVGVHRGTAFS